MTHIVGSLPLLLAVGALLAGLRLAANAYNETGRQTLRGLRKVLEGEVHAFIIDYAHACGVGFNFSSMTMAIAWDAGEWCMVYRMEELLGVELMVDGRVEGQAFADGRFWLAAETTRAEKEVALRHMLDDPHRPFFMLELWNAEHETDEAIPDGRTAVENGNRWLEGMVALMAPSPHRRLEIDEAA